MHLLRTRPEYPQASRRFRQVPQETLPTFVVRIPPLRQSCQRPLAYQAFRQARQAFTQARQASTKVRQHRLARQASIRVCQRPRACQSSIQALVILLRKVRRLRPGLSLLFRYRPNRSGLPNMLNLR